MSNKKQVLERWELFARKHNLELNLDVDLDLKAKVCADYNNGCPCLPKWRSFCPCKGALEDIKDPYAGDVLVRSNEEIDEEFVKTAQSR